MAEFTIGVHRISSTTAEIRMLIHNKISYRKKVKISDLSGNNDVYKIIYNTAKNLIKMS